MFASSFPKCAIQIEETDAKELRNTGETEYRRLYKDVFGEKSATLQKDAVETYQAELAAHEYPNGGKLRDYQAEGVAWMLSNYLNQRSSVLADEMGTLSTRPRACRGPAEQQRPPPDLFSLRSLYRFGEDDPTCVVSGDLG